MAEKEEEGEGKEKEEEKKVEEEEGYKRGARRIAVHLSRSCAKCNKTPYTPPMVDYHVMHYITAH